MTHVLVYPTITKNRFRISPSFYAAPFNPTFQLIPPLPDLAQTHNTTQPRLIHNISSSCDSFHTLTPEHDNLQGPQGPTPDLSLMHVAGGSFVRQKRRDAPLHRSQFAGSVIFHGGQDNNAQWEKTKENRRLRK